MTDIYGTSLKAKFESLLRVVSLDLGFGDDISALSQRRLDFVHSAAEQAILDWATSRTSPCGPLRPITNLQHLLNEYCAIADHL